MRVTTTVEIDEDEVLGEIGDELLVQELESRGYSCAKTGLDTRTAASLLDKLYVEAKIGSPSGVLRCVSDLLYEAKGVIV